MPPKSIMPTLLGVTMCVLSCSSAARDASMPAVQTQGSDTHSYLTTEHLGQSVRVTGQLTGSRSKGFLVTENPESRSRVTFHLDVPSKKLLRKLAASNNQWITVTGILAEVTSPWNKTLKVQSVEMGQPVPGGVLPGKPGSDQKRSAPFN